MAITYINGTTNNSASGTAVTVAVPASIAANDIAIIAVSSNNNPTCTDNGGANASTPAVTTVYTGTGARISTFYRRLDGTETGNFAYTLAGAQRWSATCAVYRGVIASGSPFDVAVAAAAEGSSTTPTGSSIDIVTAGAWIVGAACIDTASAVTWGAPDTWNNRVSTTSNQAVILADHEFASSGASGTFAFSCNPTNIWAVVGMALKPAVSSTTVPVFIHNLQSQGIL